MAKKGVLRSTTNYAIESRKHPPSNFTAGLYTTWLARGQLGGGIPIRHSSIEI